MTSTFQKEKLTVEIYESRAQMAQAAAREIEAAIADIIRRKGSCNVIFAAAPSQSDTLRHLAMSKCIDWGKVNAFHMDEYVGLPREAPQGFANFLRAALFDRLPFGSVNCMDSMAPAAEESARYAKLLEKMPPDLVIMGIGENGHIAFNDPPVADFADPLSVKLVTLEEACRLQQVHDGCFAQLDQVPETALTLTIPAMLAAEKIVCIVPAATKAEAVSRTLNMPVSEACPATVLRRHPNARLYLDDASSALLRE